MSPKALPAAWRNPEAWRALRDGRTCPICKEGRPRDLLGELGASWVTGPEVAPLPGYACVVSKRHVVEPFDLPPADQARFWQDIVLTATALASLFRPVKMNYEIHGNTIPHLHLHLFPRYLGDPYEGGPIDGSRASFRRTPEQLAQIRQAIAEARDRRASGPDEARRRE